MLQGAAGTESASAPAFAPANGRLTAPQRRLPEGEGGHGTCRAPRNRRTFPA